MTDLFAGSQRELLSPRQLNLQARQLIEHGLGSVWVMGEVVNFAAPPSGHRYFSLRDDRAQVRCAWFKPRRRLAAPQIALRDGMQIIMRARPSIYEARGEFQLIVEQVEAAGDGLLRAEIEARKARLAADGLLDPSRRRPLPTIPQSLGLITSPHGAAIRDVAAVLGRRFPAIKVALYPCLVQGAAAPAQLVDAIGNADKAGHDTILITRGGGSLEDLMAFNDENLARAVAACRTPIVSAVGHETDISLTDLTADLRAPTPSAAAELIVPEVAELLRRIRGSMVSGRRALSHLVMAGRQANDRLQLRLHTVGPLSALRTRRQKAISLRQRLAMQMRAQFQTRARALGRGLLQLHHLGPNRKLAAAKSSLTLQHSRLRSAGLNLVASRRTQVADQARALQLISPQRLLEQGYSIAWQTGDSVVRSVAQVGPADRLKVQVADGRFEVKVQ